ncbi:glycoside hydrolase family 16 protein [Aeromicrobium sp.]|uniref:glycoside hydrolase family 16 protein n=1 Tax=Aeromicrobium sp. TaxID=1871063 RepID=UPI0030C08697
MTNPITLRRAERADAEALLRLITALADFEKLPPPDAEARALAMKGAVAEAQALADEAANPSNPEDPPPTSACGQQRLKADGTPWSCTFAEDFRGTELDTQSWSAVKTSTSRYSYGDCFLGQGSNLRVLDGTLRLTTKKEAAPFACDHPAGPFETEYTSASVTSLGKFSQTYGRVEIRAAMPQTQGPGLQSALWLVPDEPWFYGAWPHSGEIDIAEFFSLHSDRLIPTLHYDSLTPFPERTNNECLVYQPTSFHTYTLEWSVQRIKISIDGTTCLDHQIAPAAPLLGSAPFNRPFNINLTQLLGSGTNKMPVGVDFDEATLQVDYVRVWS